MENSPKKAAAAATHIYHLEWVDRTREGSPFKKKNEWKLRPAKRTPSVTEYKILKKEEGGNVIRIDLSFWTLPILKFLGKGTQQATHTKLSAIEGGYIPSRHFPGILIFTGKRWRTYHRSEKSLFFYRFTSTFLASAHVIGECWYYEKRKNKKLEERVLFMLF